MYRYTAQLKLTNKGVSEREIKSVVSQTFLKRLHPFQVGTITQQADEFYVQIRSEQKLEKVERDFQSIAKQLDMKFICVGWGWSFSDLPDDGNNPNLASDIDPFYSISPQKESSRDYRVFTLQSSLYLPIFAFFVVLVTIFFQSQQLLWFYVAACFILLVWVITQHVSRIRCTSTGIEVKFLLRPNKTFDWRHVSGLRAFPMGSYPYYPYCQIETDKGVGRFPVLFRAASGESDVLVKTILERAALRFVEAQPMDSQKKHSVLYRRFDANPKPLDVFFRLMWVLEAEQRHG